MLQQCSAIHANNQQSWEDAVAYLAQHIVKYGHMPTIPGTIAEEAWVEARRAFWHVDKAAAAVLHWIVKSGDDCEATLHDDDSFSIVLDDGKYHVTLKNVPMVLYDLTRGNDIVDALVGVPGLGLASSHCRAALLNAAKNGSGSDGSTHAFYARGLCSMRMVSRMVAMLAKVYGLEWMVIPNRMRLPSGLMVGIVVQSGKNVFMIPREHVGEFVTAVDGNRGELIAYAKWLVVG
jgi:hypothetical protein